MNQHNNMNPSPEISDDKFLARLGDSVLDLVSGLSLPVTVARNATIALDRICSAAIDIPVAHLEGKAAEIRAEAQSRTLLTTNVAEQIARQMNVPAEYAEAAVIKHGKRILQEQINRDKVAGFAVQQLQQDAIHSDATQAKEEEVPLISDEFLNCFDRESSQISTPEMQMIFGRILAGEIQKPSSFSIKTVKLLSSLDKDVAELFQRLCSLSVSLIFGDHVQDARVVSLGRHAGTNSLQSYGLAYRNFNLLQEFGLVVPDYNSYYTYDVSIAMENSIVPMPFFYQKRQWGLIRMPDRNGVPKLDGVALSQSAKELLKVVDVKDDPAYTTALQEHFQELGFQMVEIGKPIPNPTPSDGPERTC